MPGYWKVLRRREQREVALLKLSCSVSECWFGGRAAQKMQCVRSWHRLNVWSVRDTWQPFGDATSCPTAGKCCRTRSSGCCAVSQMMERATDSTCADAVRAMRRACAFATAGVFPMLESSGAMPASPYRGPVLASANITSSEALQVTVLMKRTTDRFHALGDWRGERSRHPGCLYSWNAAVL